MRTREECARSRRAFRTLAILSALFLAFFLVSSAALSEDEEGGSLPVARRSRFRKSAFRQKGSGLRRSRNEDAASDEADAGFVSTKRSRRTKAGNFRKPSRQRLRPADEDDAMNDLLDLEKSLEKAAGDSVGATSTLGRSRKQAGRGRKRQSNPVSTSSEADEQGSEEGEGTGSETAADSNSEADSAFDSSTSSLSRSSANSMNNQDNQEDQGTSTSSSQDAAGAAVDPERLEAAQALSSLKEESAFSQGALGSNLARSSPRGKDSQPTPDTETNVAESADSTGHEADAKPTSEAEGDSSDDAAASSFPLPVLNFAQPARSKYAYVSILYCGTPRDYEYFVGLRVTMKTIQQSETSADLVVIAGPKTPSKWLQILEDDGIRTVHAENLDNPYLKMASYNPRFRFVLNKLFAWLLMDYKRVVLLDADNLVLQNMDELFLCGDFCAVFLNPCIFHTGLVVLKPSKKVFRRMQRQLASLPSFDAADQGFLCSYFPDLLRSPLFEPPPNASFPAALREFKALRGHFRLPMGYQMDAIYYNLKFKWEVPCSANKVITFPGVSALKPWYWWTWPVLPISLQWHMWRFSTIGSGHEVAVALLLGTFWLALLVGDKLWGFFVGLLQKRKAAPGSPKSPSGKGKVTGGMSAWGVRLGLHRSIAAGKGVLRSILTLTAIPSSAIVAYLSVPSTVHPFMGWPLFIVAMLGMLRVMRVVLGAPRALYWLPSFLGLSVVVLALPIYSALAFKLLVMHVLAFCGGVVTLLIYQTTHAPKSDRADGDHSRAE